MFNSHFFLIPPPFSPYLSLLLSLFLSVCLSLIQTPPRNLGLVPETSHARPWGPVSPQALVPLSLAAKTHLCPSVLPQLQSKPHWLLPRQMLFILLQGLTSSHMYRCSPTPTPPILAVSHRTRWLNRYLPAIALEICIALRSHYLEFACAYFLLFSAFSSQQFSHSPVVCLMSSTC